MRIDPYFWIFPEVIEPALCDVIIQRGKDLPKHQAIAGGDLQPDLRKSSVSWFDQKDWVSGIVTHYTNLANDQAWCFDIDAIDGVQFTQYELNEFYEVHMDTFALQDNMRKLSFVLQLSSPDDYSGGDFLFHEDDGTFTPDNFEKRGSIIVFPSFLMHQVKPVTDGERYSLVSWFTGPQMK